MPFLKIARGAKVFPVKSKFTDQLPNLRKVCHVTYALPSEAADPVFHEGLITIKYASTDAKWSMVDLLTQDALKGGLTPIKEKRAPACLFCSNQHQRCVLGAAHHKDVACVAHGTNTFDKAALAKLLPRHDRLGMLQAQLLATPVAPKDKVDVARVPCKKLACKKTFKSYKNANKHMRKHHGAEYLDPYAVPEVLPKAKRKSRKVVVVEEEEGEGERDAGEWAEGEEDEGEEDGGEEDTGEEDEGEEEMVVEEEAEHHFKVLHQSKSLAEGAEMEDRDETIAGTHCTHTHTHTHTTIRTAPIYKALLRPRTHRLNLLIRRRGRCTCGGGCRSRGR